MWQKLEDQILTEHWKHDKVVIDIITLDSSSCAPCQYMVDAVGRASDVFGDKVVYNQVHHLHEGSCCLF